MHERLGFSVRIFVPSGEPEGVRVVEKSGWTGQGLVFPRSRLEAVRRREELKRTGVYVLWGSGGSEYLPSVYVGEGDVVLRQLDEQAKTKDFWTHGAAFTSKDQSLNKAHIQYLEARLVELAAEAKRCELDNASIPQKPTLSDADRADAELYLTDMLLCLPVVGVRFFEKPQAPAGESHEFSLTGKGVRARGYEGANDFVVRAGSQVAKEEVAALRPSLSELRKTLVAQNILKETSTAYQLDQDYGFSSPSTAASVLLGRPANGRLEWKDAEGRSLKEVQEALAEAT